MNISLKRGMISVLMANIVNLGFSLLLGFLLPSRLSVETYALVKLFQLYASYAGLLHFGYVDGIYLKYGGKNLQEIEKDTIDKDLSTMRLFQLFVMLVVFVIGVIMKNSIVVAFAVAIFPANMVAYYKNVYQAVGEFKLYSRVLGATTISYFIINCILIFLLHTDLPILYISVYIIVDTVLWVILELNLKKKVLNKLHYLRFSLEELLLNIKNGILLTVGNFSSILLTTMDRWFVQVLLTTLSFAQYSFAVSMENFLNVAVTPISVTMYNYFCTNKDETKIIRIRNCTIILSTIIIASAFPAKFIIEKFLIKYVGSIKVLFILFGSQLFYVVIKSVYINLYKAQKRQRKYFIGLVVVIFIGFLFNVIGYLIYKGNESFAIGTMLSAVVWLIICNNDYPKFKLTLREFVYLLLEEIVFLISGCFMNSISGLCTYVAITVALSFLLLPEDSKYLIANIRNIFIIFKGRR